MIEARARILGIDVDLKRNTILTIVVQKSPDLIEGLKDKDLRLNLKQWRNKRSLDANAYFHVLCSKIAEVDNRSMTEVKNQMIREYGYYLTSADGKCPTYQVVAEYAEELLNQDGMHIKILDRYFLGNIQYCKIAFLRGSHDYDSKEMAHLIEGTISEAKDRNIETLTPEELQQMFKELDSREKKTLEHSNG